MSDYKSLFEVLQQSTARYGDKPALIYKQQSYSYHDIVRAATRFAAQLQSFGVRRGDRVVICCGNRPETAIAFWGAQAAGATVALISAEQDVAKGFILQDSDATVLVAERTLFDALAPRLSEYSHLRGAILVGPAAACEPGATVQVVSFPGAAGAEHYRDPGTISEDLAALIYTSGSTGQPKGVMMTHAKRSARWRHSTNTCATAARMCLSTCCRSRSTTGSTRCSCASVRGRPWCWRAIWCCRCRP